MINATVKSRGPQPRPAEARKMDRSRDLCVPRRLRPNQIRRCTEQWLFLLSKWPQSTEVIGVEAALLECRAHRKAGVPKGSQQLNQSY